MLNSLDKKIFDKKFVEFLVEKRIHPSHLLKLAHQINSKTLMNEEGMTGFLGGVGGGLKGLYQGGDYKKENVAGNKIANVVIFDYIEGISTTEKIRRTNEVSGNILN